MANKGMQVDIRFNIVEIVQGVKEAFVPANRTLGTEFQKRITDNIWRWPRGQSPRDIVDTGQLRSSYKGDPETETTFLHQWPTDYAAAVHEGAVFDDGSTLPARPWVRVTLRDVDFRRIFANRARRNIQRLTMGK